MHQAQAVCFVLMWWESSVCLSTWPLQGLGWIVTHEEDLPELLSFSALLARPPTSPEQAAGVTTQAVMHYG